MNDKEEVLELIKLLTAIEAWSFGKDMPGYLFDAIAPLICSLEQIILGDDKLHQATHSTPATNNPATR